MALLDKLAELEIRYEALGKELSDPANMTDGQRIAKLSRERGSLEKLMQPYQAYMEAGRQMEESRELLAEDDAEMQAMAQAEIERLEKRREELLDELKALVVSEDEDAHRDAIVEVRAGTGGDEATLFAGDLFRMYEKLAERKRWKLEVMDSHTTEAGGLRDITFSLSGDGVFATMQYESGGHRVQRVPKTESQGRIHTSAATVAVMPEADAVEVDIKPDDLKIDLYSAGGPGGQHVNKTQSAVRITHLPSGFVVQCQDERSQHKNKERAMRHLRSRLYDHLRYEKEKERGSMRKALIGTGDRSDRIRTYNFPQNRVTDHRINFNLHALAEVLEGNIDALIERLQEHDKELKLAAL